MLADGIGLNEVVLINPRLAKMQPFGEKNGKREPSDCAIVVETQASCRIDVVIPRSKSQPHSMATNACTESKSWATLKLFSWKNVKNTGQTIVSTGKNKVGTNSAPIDCRRKHVLSCQTSSNHHSLILWASMHRQTAHAWKGPSWPYNMLASSCHFESWYLSDIKVQYDWHYLVQFIDCNCQTDNNHLNSFQIIIWED